MFLQDSKADRAIRDRAYRLAESGRFPARHEVEKALIGEGWPNARRVLRGEYVMRAIEEKCKAAQARGGQTTH